MPATRQPRDADEGGDIVADRGVNERIAHDAFFCVTSVGFELRLDQRQRLRRRPRELRTPPAGRA